MFVLRMPFCTSGRLTAGPDVGEAIGAVVGAVMGAAVVFRVAPPVRA